MGLGIKVPDTGFGDGRDRATLSNWGSVQPSVECLNSRILVALSRIHRMSSQAIGRFRHRISLSSRFRVQRPMAFDPLHVVTRSVRTPYGWTFLREQASSPSWPRWP